MSDASSPGPPPASDPLPILPYALPDADLLADRASPYRALAWIPPGPMVVLGNSSRADRALEEAHLLRDGIPVTRRRSGGESMFLSPRMAAITVVLNAPQLPAPEAVFRATGGRILEALRSLGVEAGTRGTSDLALGERKILGSAIHMAFRHLFFHAVLNVGEDPERIGCYLRHPVREPAYRQGRPHADFVTSLHRAGHPLEPEACRRALEAAFREPI